MILRCIFCAIAASLVAAIVLTLTGCSKKVEMERFAVATPMMFKTCEEKCNNRKSKLDKVFIQRSYGHNKNYQPYCSLHAQCLCKTEIKDYRQDTFVIQVDEFMMSSVGGDEEYFGNSAIDQCASLLEDK